MALLQGIGPAEIGQESTDPTVQLSSSDATDIVPWTERERKRHKIANGFDRANNSQASDPRPPASTALENMEDHMPTQIQLDCIIRGQRISNVIELNALEERPTALSRITSTFSLGMSALLSPALAIISSELQLYLRI